MKIDVKELKYATSGQALGQRMRQYALALEEADPSGEILDVVRDLRLAAKVVKKRGSIRDTAPTGRHR